MKVLHLDSGREMRGGQWQVLQLHEGLGADSMLLCRRASPLMEQCRTRGLPAEELSIAALALHSRKVNVVHAHDARSHTWAAAVGGAPLVVSRRVAFPLGRSWLSKWKYAKADHYVAVSGYVRSILAAAGIPEEKISVVYDGVEISSSLAIGTDIVAVATDDPMKGTALLNEAMELAGVSIRYSTNLPSDLQQAALFVYITHSEGLGSAALLAMAAGVPVVASNVGGLPEIVQDGVNGVLTANDASAIAAAIRHGLDRRAILAENARTTIKDSFTIRMMLNKTIDVYQRVSRC